MHFQELSSVGSRVSCRLLLSLHIFMSPSSQCLHAGLTTQHAHTSRNSVREHTATQCMHSVFVQLQTGTHAGHSTHSMCTLVTILWMNTRVAAYTAYALWSQQILGLHTRSTAHREYTYTGHSINIFNSYELQHVCIGTTACSHTDHSMQRLPTSRRVHSI